ncbi:SDR family oxidoreductase [Kineosporia babensis]|uniref:SDR family oxidoreductase n=1 Tax=Kineosporia babensis TaxID=499548 RepID=A0A9X1NB63_9ACTN|nr:SDR family oxidoreductase [Kineosporia babensis]MCD5310576.1 SDR family oxidoreductase [Kineosporia babensis]
MTDLTGKVAVVTGSARGIGKAVALRYASLGARVVVNYFGDDQVAGSTVAECRAAGGEAIAVKADVSKVEDIERLYRSTREQFGRIDIVVANAGFEIVDQPVLEATEEQFDRIFAVNTKGAFFTLQKGAKYVADGGRLILIGSSSTASPVPGTGLYSSSKMAARQLVRVLAAEMIERSVTVNTILPAPTDGAGVFTDLAQDAPEHEFFARIRFGQRLGRPDDVADAAEYFAGDLASYVSGQSLLLSGGAIV